MEQTMLETEPHQSQENTRTSECLKCKQKRRLYKDGVCLGCYGLTIAEKEAWPDGRQTWIQCPTCGKEWSKLKDSGVCFDCDQKKFEDFLQKKRMEEKMRRIFGSVKAMNYYTFERFNVNDGTEKAYDNMKNFDARTQNTYLYGSCGVGKTHLAYAAAKAYALNGREVTIATPLKIVDGFRMKNEWEKEDRFKDFTECDLLLIDDLGISKHTDFALEVLSEILNRRQLQMRNGLIVTSNLSLDKLSGKNLDDRLPSRLAGLCEVIQLIGDDFRLRQDRKTKVSGG